MTTSMCSHGIAVILLLEQWKICGYQEIPALLSCTSLPQQWDKPRGEKIQPEPVSQMVVAKPGNQRRKRKPIMASYVDNRNNEVTDSDISRLKEMKELPIHYLVESVSMATSFSNTPYGPQIWGSALSYQAPLIEPVYVPREDNGCGNITFPQECYVYEKTTAFLLEHNGSWEEVKVDVNQAQDIEKSTRAQSDSDEWFSARAKRVTSSVFGNIIKRKKVVNESFMNSLFGQKTFQSKPTSYGKSSEKTAKAMYIKTTGAHLHDVGLLINPAFPFLRASPDAVVCAGGSSHLLEVKC